MKKIKKLINEHKTLAVIIILSLVLLIILLIIFLSLILGQSRNSYGNRLEGISEVKISKKTYTEIEEKIKDTDKVEKVSTRLQGKIVYVDVTFKTEVTVDDAKNIANTTLECFSQDQLEYYDIEYVLIKKSTEEDANGFNIMGTKHPNNTEIGWIKS